MAKHAETAYRQVPYVNEFECEGNCPQHGPFPTEWSRPTLAGTYDRPAVRWERYCAPYTVEYRDVPVEVPS